MYCSVLLCIVVYCYVLSCIVMCCRVLLCCSVKKRNNAQCFKIMHYALCIMHYALGKCIDKSYFQDKERFLRRVEEGPVLPVCWMQNPVR